MPAGSLGLLPLLLYRDSAHSYLALQACPHPLPPPQPSPTRLTGQLGPSRGRRHAQCMGCWVECPWGMQGPGLPLRLSESRLGHQAAETRLICKPLGTHVYL